MSKAAGGDPAAIWRSHGHQRCSLALILIQPTTVPLHVITTAPKIIWFCLWQFETWIPQELNSLKWHMKTSSVWSPFHGECLAGLCPIFCSSLPSSLNLLLLHYLKFLWKPHQAFREQNFFSLQISNSVPIIQMKKWRLKELHFYTRSLNW